MLVMKGQIANLLCCNLPLLKVNESVEVLVENVNDNPPNFAQNHYILDVNEVIHIRL